MAAPSVTHTFVDATTIVHSEVNQNFTDVINAMGDGNDDFTISALTCGGAVTLNGAVTLGNATGDDIAINGRITTDFDPKTAATNTLGDATQTWLSLYLDGSATNGGTIYFNASSTAFIRSNAAGTDLLIDAFTTLTVDANIVPQTDVTNTLGTSSLNYTALHLDNSATDGGAVFFNAGTTAFLKSNAAGTTLSSGGFTTVALPAITASTTLGVTGIATFTAAPVFSSVTASQTLEVGAGKALQSVAITGTGSYVKATSPTMVTPTLGVATATSVTLSGQAATAGIESTTEFTIKSEAGINFVIDSDASSSDREYVFYADGFSTKLMVIGEDGDVGIGEASPSSANGSMGRILQLTGTGSGGQNVSIVGDNAFATGSFFLESHSSTGVTAQIDLRSLSATTGEINFLVNSGATEVMTIATGGLVGIGTSNPGATLEVVRAGGSTDIFRVYADGSGATADAQLFSVNNGGTCGVHLTNWASSSSQDVGTSGTTGNVNFVKFTSSKRYKKDIRPLDFDTSWIYDTKPVNFTFINNEPEASASKSVGYIAEDISKIAPNEFVFWDDELKREESLHYKLFVVPIIEEMKKLKAQNEDLLKRIETLEAG